MCPKTASVFGCVSEAYDQALAIQKDVNVNVAELTALGARIVGVAETANVFIVQDVSKPPARMCWLLALCGGTALSPAFVRSKGRHGFMLKFDSAMETKRCLWMTSTFEENSPVLVDLLRKLSSRRNSRWRFMSSEREIAGLRGKAIILAAASEKKELRKKYKSKKSVEVQTSSEFLSLVKKVDRSCSKLSL